MRSSKIFSILSGSSEETVLNTKAQLGSLFGTRKDISNPEEISYVVENLSKAIPAYISIKALQLDMSDEEVIHSFFSMEELISAVLFEYYLEINKNTTFIQTFNRVITHYYQYNGTIEGMRISLSFFCRDLEELAERI